MAQGYLDKFRTSLPKVQGNQVLKRLISERDGGGIRTIDEFKDRLKKLTTELLKEQIKPTLTVYKALTGDDISSEQYNEMLAHIEDDLETAFAEADNIDSIVGAHHNLIFDVALKSLRYGINELESKITLYEFLDQSGKGFDDVLFNTFREAQGISTARTDKAASGLFLEPRTGSLITSAEDASVDLFGERLTLGPDVSYFISPRNVSWLTNQYSQRGEIDVTLPDSSIRNIIDGISNTYWTVPLLFSNVQPNGVFLEVCLYLPSSQDVSFVEIEPASDFPLYLAQIDYFDIGSVRRVLDTTEYLIEGPVKINFAKITTSALVLRFRQDNYKESQFKPRLGDSNFSKATMGQKSLAIDIDSVEEDLRDKLSSDFVMTDVLSLPVNTNEVEKYYQYTFGLDNIRPGYSTYDERGVFVSKVKHVTFPSQVGVKVLETRPIQEFGVDASLETHSYPDQSTVEDEKFHYGVVEYWLASQSYTTDNYLISTDIVPILPLTATRVYHEQLIFTRKSDTSLSENDMASMRFYCEDDDEDVLLYKNGSLLAYGVLEDWVFVTNADDANITVTVPNSGSPMKRGIKLNDARLPLDIYTVSYSPVVSDTIGLTKTGSTVGTVIDLTGDNGLRVVKDNVIVFNKLRNSKEVAAADLYLIILLKRNSARTDLTPAVEEYLLATGSRDTKKFGS